ncbi:MAG: hypothetical protein ACI8Y6_000656, partial [Brevundimonas sp.]
LVIRRTRSGLNAGVAWVLPRFDRLCSLLERLVGNRQIEGLGQDKRGVLAFCFPEPGQTLARIAETDVDLR